MNLQEFAALKVGDKVENPMSPGSHGVISATSEFGVRVQWGLAEPNPRMMDFAYTVNSTAWMHWSKVEPDDGTAPHQPGRNSENA